MMKDGTFSVVRARDARPPIEWLRPVDVLQVILSLTLSDYPCPDPKEAPPLLLQVRRSWRSASYHTPALWTQLNILMPTDNPLTDARRNTLDTFCLEPAGSFTYDHST